MAGPDRVRVGVLVVGLLVAGSIIFSLSRSPPPATAPEPAPPARPPARRILYEPPAGTPGRAEPASAPEPDRAPRPDLPPDTDSGIVGGPNVGAIRGTVRTKGGVPIRGVRIAVLPPGADWRRAKVAAVTDGNGRFFAPFGDGNRDRPVRVVADCVERGFVIRERIVSALADEVEIELERGRAIAGRATGPDGMPLAGATVHILEDYRGDPDLRRPIEGRVVTRTNGSFSDLGFADGVYRIFLFGELDGHEFVAVKEGVLAGEDEVGLEFRGFGSLALAFEDARTGAAVTPATVCLEYIWGHTGEEEHYVPLRCWNDVAEVTADHLPEGDYRVRARGPGYVTLLSDLVHVTAGEDLGLLRFRLTPR